MEFKEKNENLIFFSMNQLPECFVYFLLDGKEVVYVGQTKSGLSRPLSHKNKVFDRYGTNYINNTDLEKFHYFIFKTNHLLRRLGDNSTAAVIPKEAYKYFKETELR